MGREEVGKMGEELEKLGEGAYGVIQELRVPYGDYMCLLSMAVEYNKGFVVDEGDAIGIGDLVSDAIREYCAKYA